MTVARRLELAHDQDALESIETEILSFEPIVVKAKVWIKGRSFTGISAVLPQNARPIEKQNPYEVAETSAVGRALGFAGFGLVESVASAEDMVRSVSDKDSSNNDTLECVVCGEPAIIKEGVAKNGKNYKGIFCTTGDKAHTKWFYSTKS